MSKRSLQSVLTDPDTFDVALHKTAASLDENIDLFDLLEQYPTAPDSITCIESLFQWLLETGQISPQQVQPLLQPLQHLGLPCSTLNKYACSNNSYTTNKKPREKKNYVYDMDIG